jgi:serine/threonine protein kinase/TPR repeat protein
MDPKKSNDPDYLGHWRIMGRLGEGGFGTVFLAESGAQKAAIKVIRQEFVQEDDARSRLATEAEILSKLSDPSIGKILDSDLTGEFPWIATEFINGPTLEDKVKYEGPLDEIAWFNLAANIFHAIVTANEFRIIHKDIKPSNIILGETGNKLIDFGIAHISGQTRTAIFGDREGSTPFSSPEHFTIKPNPKMDVFSAAATLAYAAKGNSIWKGENDLQLMRSINEDEPNLEGLTENQKKFIYPLLEKNPSDRPGAISVHKSALEFIEFLLGKTKQPRSIKSRSKIKRAFSSKRTLSYSAIAFLGVIAIALQSGIFANEATDQLTSQCQTSLQNGNLDLAIEACTRAVAAGSKNANFLLARAHLAKGSDEQAKLVLQGCKSQSLTCKSDYAYFFETGAQSLESLKSVDKDGDNDAAWRIGNYYQGKKDKVAALSWYEKSSEAKNPIADIYLAVYWGEEKQYEKAIDYAKRAINGDLTGRPSLVKIDHPVERLIESLYTKSGDSAGKMEFFTKCASEMVAFCVSTVANSYLEENDLVNAKKWGLIGAELQDAKSMWVLARVAREKNTLLPKGVNSEAIDSEIVGWYRKAAELGDVQSSFTLGFSYSMGVGSLKLDFKESCSWYQKTMAAVTARKGTYLEEETDKKVYSETAQFFQLQSCQTVLLGDAPALSFASPAASNKTGNGTTKMTSPSAVPTGKISDGNLAPLLSYKTSQYSEKVSTNVKSSGIFGRAFLDVTNEWIIPLTNSENESVPPINRVQFRDSSLPYGSWWNMPYELKNSGSTGWQAVVSNLGLQILHSTGKKVCPEFRFALVQNGLVTYLWTKSVEPCNVE